MKVLHATFVVIILSLIIYIVFLKNRQKFNKVCSIRGGKLTDTGCEIKLRDSTKNIDYKAFNWSIE